MKKLFKLFEKRPQRQEKILEAMQVGISPVCNLKCTFCPTTHYPENNQEMISMELFNKLKPYFSWANWIYLQGWGEPLLNKNIWEMIKLVKEADCQVGFTTNGVLLTPEVREKILKFGVNLVSISIAGDTPQTHNKLRMGSELEKIMHNVENLIILKQRHNSSLPKVSLSYMLTTESIHHLPAALRRVIEIGADDLYAINLDYVFSWEADANKAFTWGKDPSEEYLELIARAKGIAMEKNFSFRSYLLSLKEEEPACELNPNKFVFITADGDVAPCTYLGRKINPRIYRDELIEIPCKSFGNINKETFEEIWHKPDYKEFRHKFALRLNKFEKLMKFYSEHEPSLIRIRQAEEDYNTFLIDNPLPEECQSCPKRFGI
ncbi:MAG: radical SAM protein [Bacillota bacterium]